jgi:Peptidase family M23
MATHAARTAAMLVAPLILVGVWSSVPALADDGPPEVGNESQAPIDSQPPIDDEIPPIVRDIVFPIVGVAGYSDGFGACRDGCTRLHEGIDILTRGWKGVPVVAAHDGTVTRVGLAGELAGCSVDLVDAEGWKSRYLHLNTDLPGTDLAADACVAPGIAVGAEIPAGTVIGWVGDTGNAEDTVPHLHFEIRDPEGVAIDPFLSLESARRISFRWITPADSLALMSAAFPTTQPLVYVIEPGDITRLTDTPGATVRFDAPVILYDAADPGPARTAIRSFEPERIVLLVDDGVVPAYMDDLRTLAPIVERSFLPSAVPPPQDPGATPTEEDAAAGVHEQVDTRLVTIVTTTSGRTAHHVEVLASTTPSGVVPIIVTGRDADRGIGMSGVDVPGPEANPDGLWWMTAEGWRHGVDPSEAPDPGIAYLPSSDLADENVAFLLSIARAPAMPLWSYQPTSRATRSL